MFRVQGTGSFGGVGFWEVPWSEGSAASQNQSKSIPARRARPSKSRSRGL